MLSESHSRQRTSSPRLKWLKLWLKLLDYRADVSNYSPWAKPNPVPVLLEHRCTKFASYCLWFLSHSEFNHCNRGCIAHKAYFNIIWPFTESLLTSATEKWQSITTEKGRGYSQPGKEKLGGPSTLGESDSVTCSSSRFPIGLDSCLGGPTFDLAKLKNSLMESSFFSCLDVSHLDGFLDSERFDIDITSELASKRQALHYSSLIHSRTHTAQGVGMVADRAAEAQPQIEYTWTITTGANESAWEILSVVGEFTLCISLGLEDLYFCFPSRLEIETMVTHNLRKPYSLSGTRSCGTFSLDAWVVGKEAVSGSVKKLKTEYLSRFTLGKPTKVELRVEKKICNLNSNCKDKIQSP